MIKIKTIAFNISDPDQKALYEHAEKRTNFSAYGKRLIQRDMEGYRPTEKPKENIKKFVEGFI